MFIFSFKTKGKFLIQHVIISGCYLTLYTTKKESIELQPLINKLGLSTIVSADHPKHVFLHNPFISFSRAGDEVPHKHLQFSKKDRLSNLQEICAFLVERQSNSVLRQQDHDQLISALDMERESRGESELPHYIQDSLANCDLAIQFLPAHEVILFLNSFKMYLESTHLSKHIELVSTQAELFLDRRWKVVYNNMLWPGEDKLSENERHQIAYFELLVDFRMALLCVKHENSINNNIFVKKIIETLRRNPCYLTDRTSDKERTAFYINVNQIECNSDANLNKILTRYLLLGFLVGNLCLQIYQDLPNVNLLKNSFWTLAVGLVIDTVMQSVIANFNNRNKLSILNSDLMKARPDNQFKRMGHQELKHIFGFFSSRDLKVLKRVDKEFKRQGDKVTALIKNEIFYTVRSRVSKKELKDSFNQSKDIALISNTNDHLQKINRQRISTCPSLSRCVIM